MKSSSIFEVLALDFHSAAHVVGRGKDGATLSNEAYKVPYLDRATGRQHRDATSRRVVGPPPPLTQSLFQPLCSLQEDAYILDRCRFESTDGIVE